MSYLTTLTLVLRFKFGVAILSDLVFFTESSSSRGWAECWPPLIVCSAPHTSMELGPVSPTARGRVRFELRETTLTATLTFHPLGNADCTRFDLADGKKMLVDYADMKNRDDPWDRRIDLPAELKSDLRAAQRDYYIVVG